MKLTKEQRESIRSALTDLHDGKMSINDADRLIEIVVSEDQPSEKKVECRKRIHELKRDFSNEEFCCFHREQAPCHSSKREKVELPDELGTGNLDTDEQVDRNNIRICRTINQLIRYLKAKEENHE